VPHVHDDRQCAHTHELPVSHSHHAHSQHDHEDDSADQTHHHHVLAHHLDPHSLPTHSPGTDLGQDQACAVVWPGLRPVDLISQDRIYHPYEQPAEPVPLVAGGPRGPPLSC
jgi:hypothetical protein